MDHFTGGGSLLLERWRQAAASEGQAVLLVGEAGIGKSRLVRATLDALAGHGHVTLRYQCSPHHTSSPLWPVVQQLGLAAGLAPGDPEPDKLDKLEALLRQAVEDPGEAAPLLAALLGIDPGARYPALALTTQEQRTRTLAALAGQLLGLARRRPVLMVLEDAHWIDPTTLELVGQALDRIANARVLMLVTSRPDNQPALGGHPDVTRLTLNRLGRGPTEAMITCLTGGRTLSAEVLEQIAARTDGVPLFVEELTKAVIEAGLPGADADRAAPAVPASLHDSLMARLDREPGLKEVAQVGACIGREFAYPLLAAISSAPEAALQAALGRLAAAELVFPRGNPPEATYSFKHALVRDAAYESLLRTRRQQLHSRIARVLKERFADRAAAEPELLAHHHTEAGEIEPAIDNWLAAGQRATERSANLEAIAHLRRGLELVARLPDGVERARRELALQVALGMPLIATKGYGAPEAEAALARARELCDRVGDAAQLLPILYRQWAYHIVHPETRMARHFAEEFLRSAEGQGAEGPALVARRALGFSQYELGDLVASRANLQQVRDLYDVERDRTLAYQYGQDNLSSALALLSLVLWLLGHPDQAVRMRDETITRSHETAHAHTVAYAHTFAGCVFSVACRDWLSAREHGASLITFTEQQRLPLWHGWVNFLYRRALVEPVPTEAVLAQMREALAEIDATGTRNNLTFHLALLAEVHGRLGQGATGLGVIDEALAQVEASDERWWEAEIYRVRGELSLSLTTEDAAGAEACFERAMRIARRQSAKSLQLRAAASLARLWLDRGRRSAARDLLAPVYAWFTEGFDTPDLQQAKELLEALG